MTAALDMPGPVDPDLLAAGGYVLGVLALCLGAGAAIGAAAGSVGIGLAVGAVVGIPASISSVVVRYRKSG